MKPSLSLLALTLFSTGLAHANPWQEIPVGKVFIPESGYDDNDEVGLVIDGELPNGCYTVGPAVVERHDAGNTLRVRQMAFHDRSGYCGRDATTPGGMKRPVPFTLEVALGQLKAGAYVVQYTRSHWYQDQRRFKVDQAPTRSIDSEPYALITGIDQADYARAGTSVVPVLTGILTSSCSHLNRDVPILDEGDVFVALPTQRFHEAGAIPASVKCADLITPFRLPIDLGTPAPGRYLLHVRSMNGRAVNKVFGVYQD